MGDDTTRTELVTQSPVDALRLVVAAAWLLLFVLLDWLCGEAVVDFVSDLLSGFTVLDGDGIAGLAVLARVATIGLVAAGFVYAAQRGRRRFVLTAALGGVAGALLTLIVDPLLDAEAPPLFRTEDLLGPLGERGFPTAVGIAAVTGIVAAGSPWVARRWRRLGWVLVLALAVIRAAVAPLSFETAAAVACGALGGALVDLLLGTPSRRPTKAAVIEGLTRAGVQLADLEAASVDARGSTPYFGHTVDGTRLFVKALGTDERKADLLFRLVRSLIPRDLGDERPFSSLRRAVEHEAFLALAAQQVGVRTPPLAGAGFAAAEPGGYVLAYVAIAGSSLDGVPPEDITDEVLAGIWEQMAVLRTHGIAHRDLRLANVFLAEDGAVWFIDFGFSEMAASDLLLATDLAEMVTSSSLAVGAERAVAAARAAVGAPALQDALPRFAPGFLAGATRTALKERPGHLDAVRAQVRALS